MIIDSIPKIAFYIPLEGGGESLVNTFTTFFNDIKEYNCTIDFGNGNELFFEMEFINLDTFINYFKSSFKIIEHYVSTFEKAKQKEIVNYINPTINIPEETQEEIPETKNNQVIITIETEYGSFIDEFLQYMLTIFQATKVHISLERISETKYLLFFQHYKDIQAGINFLKESIQQYRVFLEIEKNC